MGNIILIIIGVICIFCCGFWLKQLIWGKCPYCGSKDFVPDDGAYFYCNDCKKKF